MAAFSGHLVAVCFTAHLDTGEPAPLDDDLADGGDLVGGDFDAPPARGVGWYAGVTDFEHPLFEPWRVDVADRAGSKRNRPRLGGIERGTLHRPDQDNDLPASDRRRPCSGLGR